ncbi:hypothetical protein ACWD4G_34375 [Streptomyces sp. NPDC002643]
MNAEIVVGLGVLAVLLFVGLVAVVSVIVPIVLLFTRGGGRTSGPVPHSRVRRNDSWWVRATRADWPDGDSHGRADSSSCGGGSSSGSGSSCGGGSSSSCGSGS